ncbi:MAG: hypothetical protein ACOY71_14750, partial [Gemmatimonadota bacterium]
VADFNGRFAGRATIDTVEGKASSAEQVHRLADTVAGEFTLYVEVPLDPDPAPLVALIGASRARAKVRTGGVTPEQIPPPSRIVHFMAACLAARVPFKATAGLHHLIRGEYPLTYEPDAPRAMMYGYLNVFSAAALLLAGHGAEVAERALRDTDPTAFGFEQERMRWRGFAVATDELRALRDVLATSFGSCSFREPVDELGHLTAA